MNLFRKGKTSTVLAVLATILIVGGLTAFVIFEKHFTHKEGQKPFEVFVIHSYGKDYPDYKKFNRLIQMEFLKEGIHADLHILSLGLYEKDPMQEEVVQALDSMATVKPDLILIDNDYAALSLLCEDSVHSDKQQELLKGTPIVAGGLNTPDWENLKQYPNAVIWEDNIQYMTCMDLCRKFTGSSLIETELDFGYKDSLIREQIKDLRMQPPYIDDSDFHNLNLTGKALFHGALKDSVILIPLSLEEPYRNHAATASPEFGAIFTQGMMNHCNSVPQLVLKHDNYSNMIAGRTHKPEFTAVNTEFGTAETKYLAGIFASYETISKDMVHTAAEILRGADPKTFKPGLHKQETFIDYNALKAYHIDYKDIADGPYQIVNIPANVSHTILFNCLTAGFILAFLFLIGVIAYLVINHHQKRQHKFIEDLQKELDMRDIIMEEAQSTIAKYNKGTFSFSESFAQKANLIANEFTMEKLVTLVPAKYLDRLEVIKNALKTPGTYVFELPVAFLNDGGVYHWYRGTFTIKEENIKTESFSAVIINIDNEKEIQQNLMIASKMACEAQNRDDFLNNLTHDIRTRLQAIMGFSELITATDLPLDKKDSLEYNQLMTENAQKLLTLVESILELSRIESGRVQFSFESVNISEVLGRLQSRWYGKIPAGVKFNIVSGSEDFCISTDPLRLEQLAGELIQNSIRFTKEGSITVGWYYNDNEKEFTFYVEDTGSGIKESALKKMTSLFNNEVTYNQLGIGLKLCNVIADGLGGKLSVRSTLGSGSCFSLKIKTQTKYEKL